MRPGRPGPDGKPLGLGGLQMAERALTGESGSLLDKPDAGDGGARVITTDREHDCVPEISAAGLPAALANSITFTLTPWSRRRVHLRHDDGVRRPAQRVDIRRGALASPARAAPARRPAPTRQQTHSSPIAASPDGSRLFVVHPDADSVSILDARRAPIVHEVPLARRRPRVDPTTERFDPAVSPRALALDSHGATLYVTGQRSGRLYAIDAAVGHGRGRASRSARSRSASS